MQDNERDSPALSPQPMAIPSSLELLGHRDQPDHEPLTSRLKAARAVVRTAFTDARRDVKADGPVVAAWIFLFIWFSALISFFVVLVLVNIDIFRAAFVDCRPDGTFSTSQNNWSWWTPSGFFQITLSQGTLSFTQAKVIDIVWDVVAGRLGQALFAFVAWRIFGDYVTTSMDEVPVTYATFWLIFLFREPSYKSIYCLTRDFRLHRVLKSRVALVFIIFTMLFVLAFPTILSAMTGYQAAVQALVATYDGSLARRTSFREILYLVNDGDRVPQLNLTAGYVVTTEDTNWAPTVELCTALGDHEVVATCRLHVGLSDYAKTYGFFGLSDTNSTINGISLAKPALNITAFFIDSSLYYGRYWKDPRTNQYPFQNQMKKRYSFNSQTYALAYIDENGSCPPISDRYEWGFSFQQAFIFVVVMLLCTIGLLVMWMKAQSRLPLQGESQTPRGWRCLMDLAETMQKDLQSLGIDPRTLTSSQLDDEIRKRLDGGRVTFTAPLAGPRVKKTNPRSRFWRWLKNNKWWTTAFVVSMLASGLSLGSFTWGMNLGFLFALILGKSNGSRVVIAAFWTIAGLAVGLPILFFLLHGFG